MRRPDVPMHFGSAMATTPSILPQGVKRHSDSMSQGSSSLELQQFQAQWGIDDQCLHYVSSLPAHVQASVIAGFQHSPEQTNVSARCFAFAKKMLQSQGGGGHRAAGPAQILSPLQQ